MKIIITQVQLEGLLDWCKKHAVEAMELETDTMEEDLKDFGDTYEQLVEKYKQLN